MKILGVICLWVLLMMGVVGIVNPIDLPLKPAKQEAAVVEPVVAHQQPLCPVVGDGRPADYKLRTELVNDSGETVVMEYIHCRKCEIGALFPVENNPTIGRCSYCHELYTGVFKGED